ncbi:MAG: metallopeptidase family protein [Planctomycetota bacterium]|nr:metallopeptidase family protein [Planctomycetota bacterium]
MKQAQRDRFDALLEEVIDALPRGVRALLDEIPVVVDDVPDAALLREMGEDDPLALLGLHTGVAFTEQSVEHHAELPADIRLFREGIVDHAGGWDGPDADDAVREQIRVTLLHEIGHQFGLDEDDLDRLGYQ